MNTNIFKIFIIPFATLLLFCACEDEEVYNEEPRICLLGNVSGHDVSIQSESSIVKIPQKEMIRLDIDSCTRLFPSLNTITITFDDTLEIKYFLYKEIDSTQKTSYRWPEQDLPIDEIKIFPPGPSFVRDFFRYTTSYTYEYIFTPYDYMIAVQYQDSVPPQGVRYWGQKGVGI